MDERFMARLFAVLAVTVTAVWLIGYLAPIWRAGYQPPPELNLVMMAIIGIFVSLYNKAKHPKDDSGDDNATPKDGDSDGK
ncbi:hypothetical protein [Antrihabitans spumae]|uniref:Uncharacterized protein n=1 Tax=Antrihabitans spumae TaxID=3373370 RepID=A0ABW7KMP3_9NOCA